MRYLNVPLGLALMAVPFVWPAGALTTAVSVALGVLLVGLSFPRGPIRQRFGNWDRMIV